MKRRLSRPLGRFLALLLAAAAAQLVFHLCLLAEGDAGALLLVFNMYVLLPVLSLLVPFWAGMGGAHPFAAFFPIGGAALLFSAIPAWLCIVYMLLSLMGCVAGQEWAKRNNPTKKRGHHGGRNQKR